MDVYDSCQQHRCLYVSVLAWASYYSAWNGQQMDHQNTRASRQKLEVKTAEPHGEIVSEQKDKSEHHTEQERREDVGKGFWSSVEYQ